jgi:flagellar biogenesis protein FliO
MIIVTIIMALAILILLNLFVIFHLEHLCKHNKIYKSNQQIHLYS